jgi:hypothetical protein
MLLVQQALQAKALRDNLKALQQTQPQLTQLTHNVRQGAENSYAVTTSAEVDAFSGAVVGAIDAQNAGSDELAALSNAASVLATAHSVTDAAAQQDLISDANTSSAKRHSARRSAQLSTQVLATLHSLAQASPLTIECLKQFGESAALAEQQYDRIRRDPTVYEYYLFFIQSVSSAVLACQTIASGFVDDARLSAAENIMQGIDTAAQAVSWMGAPIVTGIGRALVGLANKIDRQRTIRRITTYFPTVDSHKYIEILARELSILLWKDIHAVFRETKKVSKYDILNRVMRAVEWLDTATNLSVVQGLACSHAARLVDALMRTEPAVVVEYRHVPLLLQWSSGEFTKLCLDCALLALWQAIAGVECDCTLQVPSQVAHNCCDKPVITRSTPRISS